MKLLITGAWTEGRARLSELEALGHEVLFLQQEREALPCDPAWVEGAVCNGLFLYHPMEAFPNLRFIQLTSAGFDRVDLDAVRARGIALFGARGVYSGPMAEFALCGVLQLYKQAAFFRDNQRARRWEKHRGLLELAGREVLILGCGSVGTACARVFSALGCRVRGVDLFPRQDGAFAEIRPLPELDAVLPAADVVILTLPLTGETRGLMSRERLSAMQPGAVLVNISRGPVVEEAALADALTDGRLGGAVLDVFAQEPLPEDSPLWGMENVILTPHNSFVGDGSPARLSACILDNLRRTFKERQLVTSD